jgi:nitrite reductase/ring-hydroxylating ferredoxin subunit
VATLAELERRGVVVVRAPKSRIAVFAHAGEVHAVDNRCPHMGFPLERGSVGDGILTCHWHQARFDLRSGCTFDLWADDVAKFETRVEDAEVFVAPSPIRPLGLEEHRRRLRRGMEQDVALVQAKSLLGLIQSGEDAQSIVREMALYGARNLPAFSEGLVRLTCVANLHPFLQRDTAYLALLFALRKISEETSGAVPRRERLPLDARDHDAATLRGWFRQWALTRHRDGAERTLLTALAGGFDASGLTELVAAGACERLFADTGHLFDFWNKAFELVALVGWEHGGDLFALMMEPLRGARGEEERTDWHHPIEIVKPLRAVEARLPDLLRHEGRSAGSEPEGLTSTLLGDNPLEILRALERALEAGERPDRLAQTVAYTAALRLARFATSNEVTDWFGPQHTFNHANAVHQAVLRSPTPDVVRAIFHAAIAVYRDRFLNVPPARLPGGRGFGTLPESPTELRELLRKQLDRRGELESCAAIVARYLRLGHPFAALVDTLVFATVREDLDFHCLQVLEAGVRQCQLWAGRPEAEHILVGVVRNLAAHCPTPRAGQQTGTIALRLHRGDPLYEEGTG